MTAAGVAKWACILWTLVCAGLGFFRFFDTTFPLNPPPGVHGELHIALQAMRAYRFWGAVWLVPAAALFAVWRVKREVDDDAAVRRTRSERRLPLATRARRAALNVHTLRGALGVLALLIVWQVAQPLGIPIINRVPPLSEVVVRFFDDRGLFWRDKYWAGWVISLFRIFSGFGLALIIGVPQGLAWGISRTWKAASFPVFEIFRPIPPLAFLPAAIYLMPTAELSIILVIFLGAYFTIVLNTINGVYNVDRSMQRAALSLGANRADVFWRVVFPGTLPSIITGATVGMGITWMVLVAAEMIAGRSGIGFLTWESYTAGDIPQVVVGMASMGVGGAICSAIIWRLGTNLTPWRRLF
ncbi:MAG: ABC transporter permease [Candidatus Rokuibacteriota bacterium]|nr:MAG: ABC transporter permease [Candidatus Rokubacteria bacterium]